MKTGIKNSILVFVCLLLLAAPATAQSLIDGSSFEAYKLSARQIYNELGGNKQKLFGKAAKYYEAMFEWGVEEGAKDPEVKARTEEIMRTLSNKNADALIDSYIMVVETNYNMTRTELDEAQKYIANAAKMNEEVSGFEILDTKFYYDENNGVTTPMIGLSVFNGAPYVVSHIYLKARVFSEGRVIPWFEEEFNFGVPNGVKINEIADWELMTDASAGWDAIPRRDDLEIKLEVVKLVSDKGREYKAHPLPGNHAAYIKMLNDQIAIYSEELAELKKLSN